MWIQALRGANLTCLKAGLPTMVLPVDGLIGVGVADEPPDVQVEGGFNISTFHRGVMHPDQHSFGTFLAKVIWMALEDTKTGSKDEFVQALLMLFNITRIDPMQPHLHPDACDLGRLQRSAAFSKGRRRK